MVDDDVDVAVVVEVAERGAPADVPRGEVRARRRGSRAGTGGPSPSTAGTLRWSKRRLGDSRAAARGPGGCRRRGRWRRSSRASRRCRSRPGRSPSRPRACCRRPGRRGRRLGEEPSALAGTVRTVPQVLVEVLYSFGKLVTNSSGRPSPSTSSASTPMPDWAWPLLVEGGARGLGGVLEGAVALVEEEEVRVHVVGDVEVDLAVAVEVGGDDAEAVAVGPADARRVGHVGEGAVAVVAVEEVLGRPDRPRRAEEPDVRVVAADDGRRGDTSSRRSWRRRGRGRRRCRSRGRPRPRTSPAGRSRRSWLMSRNVPSPLFR